MSVEEKRPLPEGWTWSKVEDVAEVNYGKGLPKRDRNNEGRFPVYGSSGVVGYHDNAIAKEPCLVIGRKGAAGAVHLSTSECWPIDTTYYVMVNEGVDLKYAYYALGVLGLEELDRSTAIPSLSRDDLHAQFLPIAPLPKQQLIVAEIEKQFTRLDQAVASLKRAQANLQRYKASVLKAACEGKLVPQDPNDEPAEKLLERILTERRARWEEEAWVKLVQKAQKKVAQNGRKAQGLPARLSDLEPEEWQDIPEADYARYLPKNDKWKEKYKEPLSLDDIETPKLPEIPESWVWATISQVTWKIKDGPHYSPQYSESGIPFISGGNVRPSGVDFTSAKYISFELHKELSKRCKPEVEDILYTKGGTTGIARVNTYDFEFNVWVHIAVLKLNQPINPFYLQHALNSPLCYAQAQRYTHGVGNQDLGLTRMIRIVFALPPLAEQDRIVDEVERRLSVIAANEKAIAADLTRAERLRQSILRQAFSGRLVPQDPV